MMNRFAFTIIFFLTSNSYAQVAYVNPGSNSGVISISSGSSFRTRVLPNRSVYCKLKNPNPSFDSTFSTNIIAPLLSNFITGTLVGDAESGVELGSGADDAIAFIANEEAGNTGGKYLYDITLTSVSPSPSNCTIECFETTLYGNFNTVTVANPYNFLELSNDSNKDLTARVLVLKNDGTIVGRFQVSVLANQQKDIAIHDVEGGANTFGRLQVAHDGGLHALRAKVTKYTSSFVITASDKLETRENSQ